MSEQVKTAICILLLIMVGAFATFDGLKNIFYGNVINYSSFEELILQKRVSCVYLLRNKAWLFVKEGSGRHSSTKQWETVVINKNRLIDFLKYNNVRLVTKPSFIHIHRNFISSLFFLGVGLIMLLLGLTALFIDV